MKKKTMQSKDAKSKRANDSVEKIDLGALRDKFDRYDKKYGKNTVDRQKEECKRKPESYGESDTDDPRKGRAYIPKNDDKLYLHSKDKDRGNRDKLKVESFLVVPINFSDGGDRPIVWPPPAYTTNNVYIDSSDYPIVKAKNVGNRAIYTALAEFSYFKAGETIIGANRRVIGYSGTPQTVLSGNTTQFRCDNPFNEFQHGDVLFAHVFDPVFDPPSSFCKPIYDRHCGQAEYAYSGIYSGTYGWPDRRFLIKFRIDPVVVSMALKYRIRVYAQLGGSIPANPQIDRVLVPVLGTFSFTQNYSFKNEQWVINMRDNNTLHFTMDKQFHDSSGRADQDFEEFLSRD